MNAVAPSPVATASAGGGAARSQVAPARAPYTPYAGPMPAQRLFLMARACRSCGDAFVAEVAARLCCHRCAPTIADTLRVQP